jgi:calcium binding protein 39
MPLLESLKEALKADRPKTGAEILARLANCLNVIEQEQGKDAKAVEKAVESIAKYLPLLVLAMRGDEEHQVSKESVLELTLEIAKTEVIYLLIRHLSLLGFETRKDVASLCSIFVRLRDDKEKAPGAQYVVARPYVLEKLFWG